jgi:Ca2+-binding RTX toxin-like protein
MPQYTGGSGDDTVTGGIGADELYGFDGNDTLNGHDGNDYLDGGQGADLMYGGTGDDTYVVGNIGDQVVEQLGEGTDTVYSSIAFLLSPNVENLNLTGSANIDGTGNALNNWLSGNAGSNVLDGREGADTMAGGPGDDFYFVDAVGDIAGEFPGEGIDTVRSSVSFGLVPEVENLLLTGDAAITGTGNDSSNYIQGNSAANILSGRIGADILAGGAGYDTFLDTNSGHNGDTISDFVRGDRIVFSDATLDWFHYQMSGNELIYSGGSLTLSGLQYASLSAAQAPEGGVQITFSSPPIVVSAGPSVPAINGPVGPAEKFVDGIANTPFAAPDPTVIAVGMLDRSVDRHMESHFAIADCILSDHLFAFC